MSDVSLMNIKDMDKKSDNFLKEFMDCNFFAVKLTFLSDPWIPEPIHIILQFK